MPALAHLNQQQQLQLLQLADAYGVHKVTCAACVSLASIPEDQLQQQTIHQIFELPSSCHQLPAYAYLFTSAAKRLQDKLGDLELVWADDAKQQHLLELPFAAFKHLLGAPQTKTSEDTVYYTISRWLQIPVSYPGSKCDPDLSEQQAGKGPTPAVSATATAAAGAGAGASGGGGGDSLLSPGIACAYAGAAAATGTSEGAALQSLRDSQRQGQQQQQPPSVLQSFQQQPAGSCGAAPVLRVGAIGTPAVAAAAAAQAEETAGLPALGVGATVAAAAEAAGATAAAGVGNETPGADTKPAEPMLAAAGAAAAGILVPAAAPGEAGLVTSNTPLCLRPIPATAAGACRTHPVAAMQPHVPLHSHVQGG